MSIQNYIYTKNKRVSAKYQVHTCMLCIHAHSTGILNKINVPCIATCMRKQNKLAKLCENGYPTHL
jgi:hypothetical protein